MVETTRDVEGDRRRAAVDELGCLKRSPCHEPRPFVDPLEYRVITIAEAIIFYSGYLAPIVHTVQHIDVISRMIKKQILFFCWYRLDNRDIWER